MDNELRKIQRHNRIIWVVLAILVALSLISVALALKSPKVSTIQQNFVGQDGKNGRDASVDYQKINNYILDAVYSLPRAKDGTDGKNGADSVVDYSKIYAYVDNSIAALPKPADGKDGVNGQDGADARASEFSCVNGNFVTRYSGDDNWRVIQENSVACKGTK